MKENLNFKTKNTNISLTAYRAIKILKLLMEKPSTSAEIIEVLKQDELTMRSVSDDTLRVTMNSLKAVGCKIARPCPKNNYHYILTEHPFRAKFSAPEINVLMQIRQYFLDSCQWRTVIELNNFYDKIIASHCDVENVDLLNKNRPFAKVRANILKTFYEKDLGKKEILMTYATSSKKIEKINISSERVFCEAGKLYVLGWYYKRNTCSYFNAEKILEFHSIEPKKLTETRENKVLYKVTGVEALTFRCNSDERILEQTEKEITVECTATSEFKIVQRLLSFGCDFELISPMYLKNHLLEKLSKIKARYEQ